MRPFESNNTDFPNGTGSPYYLETLTFRALIKKIKKKRKIKVQDFMC